MCRRRLLAVPTLMQTPSTFLVSSYLVRNKATTRRREQEAPGGGGRPRYCVLSSASCLAKSSIGATMMYSYPVISCHILLTMSSNQCHHSILFYSPALLNLTVPDGTTGRLSIRLKKNSGGRVCLLLRVTAKKDDVDLDAFTLDASTTDYTIVPIARTYSRKDWTQIAGPYAEKSTTIFCAEGAKNCKVKFPLKTDTLGSDFRVYIMSLSNANVMTFREQLSRFLTQATFGPTKSDLDNWPYVQKPGSFGNWIKAQMSLARTPMTSHRAYYRERMDHGMKWERVLGANFRPQHPCDQYSRWRDYALTGHDYGLPLKIEAFEGKYLMSVKVQNVWEVRTVVDDFKDTGSLDEYSGVGTYQMCKFLFGAFVDRRFLRSFLQRNTPPHTLLCHLLSSQAGPSVRVLVNLSLIVLLLLTLADISMVEIQGSTFPTRHELVQCPFSISHPFLPLTSHRVNWPWIGSCGCRVKDTEC